MNAGHAPAASRPLRHLVLVLGDQLDASSAALDGFDPSLDAIWMAEVAEEATHVPSTKARTVMFLSAMRHHAHALRERGFTVHYRELGTQRHAEASPRDDGGWPTEPDDSLAAQLARDVKRLRPTALRMEPPGDWRVLQSLRAAAQALDVPFEISEDRHFYVTPRDFLAHARARRSVRMEFFYREQRVRHGVLLAADGTPLGGRWNFDAENREAFGKDGPPVPIAPLRFAPDAITREVIALVAQRLASHPGTLATFDWPCTRADALRALDHFITHKLPHFGRWQDAMWPGEPWLYHAQLSAALNLKLLNPREVVAAAVAAYEGGHAPLASVEGFVRQILGWREYVRGIYWTRMPDYAGLNALAAREPLPAWYWTGDTDMACLRDAIGQTLAHGYAHHIQRLMVTGLYALLRGVEPQQVHRWYLAVYVDAVEWVELPNTLGMSQYADGGLMASKPYVASGKYIDRMSPHCRGCRFDPARRTGPDACPFTTLYWDFLLRHDATLRGNVRMRMQLRNAERLSDAERREVRGAAEKLRSRA